VLARGIRPIVLAVVAYALLAAARASADRPMVDEAWFASPAVNLVWLGSMHTSIIEPAGTFFQGIDRHTYWIPPAYPLTLAAWFSVVPPGLVSMRALSVAFGCAIVIASWLIVLRLSRDETTAGLTAALVAADFAVVRGGAVGRMDVMCAALGYAGLALYLCLRQTRWRAAFAGAHALSALAVVTHPNGVMYSLGVLILSLQRDRAQLRASTLAFGALPYVGVLALWGLYIARDPQSFVTQLGGNAANRFSGLTAPWLALRQELVLRYLAGGDALRSTLALPYAVGAAGVIALRPLAASPAVRPLALLALAFFTCQWLLESLKLYFYTIHLAPLFMALFAFVVRWIWSAWPRLRAVTALATCLLVAVHLAATAHTIRRDSQRTQYRPVVDAVRAHARGRDLIMGSAELAFGLGFDASLVDDVRLGFHSGRRPQVIVLDRRYREWIHEALPLTEPAAAAHARAVLAEFDRVAAVADYEVLVRRGEGRAH
jgi:hypothetical protein